MQSSVQQEHSRNCCVVARIRKASQTFAMLKPIGKSKRLRLKTKLRLYNSNVFGVLLFGSELETDSQISTQARHLPQHVSTEDPSGILVQHHYQ